MPHKKDKPGLEKIKEINASGKVLLVKFCFKK